MFDPSFGVFTGTLTALAVVGGPNPIGRIVEDEPAWRGLPAAGTANTSNKVSATRWRSLDHRMLEVKAETPSDRHLVAIVLRNEDVRLSLSGRTVHDGTAVAG